MILKIDVVLVIQDADCVLFLLFLFFLIENRCKEWLRMVLPI